MTLRRITRTPVPPTPPASCEGASRTASICSAGSSWPPGGVQGTESVAPALVKSNAATAPNSWSSLVSARTSATTPVTGQPREKHPTTSGDAECMINASLTERRSGCPLPSVGTT